MFVPVFLGFVVLTASVNQPGEAKKLSNLQSDLPEIIKNERPLITNGSDGKNSKQKASIFSGSSISWNSTSEVLP